MRGEFAFIDAFTAAFPKAGRGVALGVGDDCAALTPAPGHLLCATTDALVEGVHFERRTFRPEDAGHKALAVNLSDLAAMGAVPRWFLCALSLDGVADERYLLGAARGMAALAREHGCALVGGNVARGPLAFTITALGEAPHAQLLTRSGMKPGDLLYAVGTFGDAALGLELVSSRKRPAARPSPPERAQLRPTPLVRVGLAAAPHASAAIDVSDGLAQDAGHLATSSRCGVAIELGAVPISPAVKSLPAAKRWRLVTSGGEDYALLFAVRPANARALEDAVRSAGARAAPIGEALEGRGVKLRLPGGRDYQAPRGFDHLR